MTSTLPSDLQDYVFQWSDGKASYEEMRDRVVSLAVNRAAMSRPTPMEVDKVDVKDWDGGEGRNGGGEKSWEEDAVEVDYVGEACRRCGGYGRYARECPTPKGKGKGKGGAPKGGPKGWGK